MSFKSDWKQLPFKDKIDIIEAFFTIIVSVMALWGTITAWENGFFHNIKHIAEHYHHEIVVHEHAVENKL